MTQKRKIRDLSAQHIFPSKWYTTYECIPELAVTVPTARSTIVKKIKRFITWLYKWSRVTFTELLSAVVKILWHYHHFPWLFHDFLWSLLFSLTFQAWKMVFLNSMTFHDQGAPCNEDINLNQLFAQKQDSEPKVKKQISVSNRNNRKTKQFQTKLYRFI